MSSRAQVSLLVSLLLCLVSAAQTGERPQLETAVAPLSVPEYIAELDHLASAAGQLVHPADTADLIRNIPTVWRIQDPDRIFEVSTEWLRSDLSEWQRAPKREIQDRIVLQLGALRSEAASFQAPEADASSQRSRLSRILASPEFRAVQGPSWLDRLKQRVTTWLLNLLLRFFSSSAIPTISNVVVYGLIALALLALAYWMYRSIRDSADLGTILPGTLPVSSKEWSVWMAEARAAAEAGNWRDAVHFSYWCGISFLEARGMWPPDRARTPREYLRLLPSSSEHRPALRALTRNFEVVWYGTQPADAQAFSDTVTQLEKLGCQYH